MPFTLSHAAAVLPGVRRDGRGRGPFLASGLVLGSFAPDMTYFTAGLVPGAMRFGSVTHSPVGVLTVDVLVTAALVGCWLLLREPLVALLPAARRGRAYALLRGEDLRGRSLPATAGRLYVSAVVGASTHVVWDAFTHLDRYGTNTWPWLSDDYGGFPLYTYLQYGSSLLAAGALLWFLGSAWRRLPATPAVPPGVPPLGRGERWGAVALIGGCVAVGTALRVARFFTYFDRVHTPVDIVPTICFGAGAGLIGGLVLYSVLLRIRTRIRLRRRRRTGTPAPTGVR
ncbi:DUF4184 family protein [Streptomyces sp. NPDC012888]|uniref:DUF4184 family protein n=1 Tax=Streptomyces sp. NPDC012888 TaxID=3364855 RepID=UPI0036A87BAC